MVPICAYPILPRLPNLEELVCYHNYTNRSTLKSIPNSLRRPRAKEKNGEVEPVLKSLSVFGIVAGLDFNLGMSVFPPHRHCPNLATHPVRFFVALVEKFPRLRKVCVPEVNSPSPHPPHPTDRSLPLSPP